MLDIVLILAVFAALLVVVAVSQPLAARLRLSPVVLLAIIGVAIPLALALDEWWQFGVLAGAAVSVLVFRRGVVTTLLAAGAVGAVAGLVGAPLP